MKKMKPNRFIINFFNIFIVALIVEIIFRVISDLPLLELSMIRIFFSNVILASVIAFINSLYSYKISRFVNMFVNFLISLYAWLQLGFYNFLGVYISLQNASQGAAVKDYVLDFFGSFHASYFLVFIPFILYIVYVIFLSKRFNDLKKMNMKSLVLNALLLIMVSTNVYYVSITNPLFENKLSPISNKELFLNVANQSLSVSSFGTSTFGILDIRTTLFGKDNAAEKDYVFVNNSKTESDRQLNDTAWYELIKSTNNQTYNTLNNYFIKQPIASTNDYTGKFKGKNVIFVLMESANDILLEYPEYYPNTQRVLEHSWNYVNNYSPRNACATLNNEFSGMTSLFSINRLCTAKVYRNNSYPESVFGVFNNSNYNTFSSHNYTEAYYPRSSIHINMGSKEYYGVQKLGIPYSNEYINWSNDDDFMEAVLKIIDNKVDNSDKPFMTWLTTVSGHQPYSVDSIQGNKYYSMTDGRDLPSDVRRYMSKLKILDDGIGVLLDGLEERGILDDTVIVFYGDHYPYGISKDHLNKALSYDTKEDMNAEQVPLWIYDKSIEGKTVEDYTYYLNILPTVFNLMGVNYDPRLYLGEDMNSDDFESMVVFSDGSWKNQYAFYNASNSKVVNYNQHYSEQDISRINNIIESKMKISEMAISNNYFAYLDKNLNYIKNELSKETICYDDEMDSYLSGSKTSFKVEEAKVEQFDGGGEDDF
ncbi:MAG: sulfatase-like hydrolase/transferase, partial [Bacilli bacterium]|nr:sulfatase-like hydrolase/transferase [Bacilli bacterium]